MEKDFETFFKANERRIYYQIQRLRISEDLYAEFYSEGIVALWKAYKRYQLVQVANAVVRSEKHPEIRNKYLQLKKRRRHKKAIIAIARRLLVAIYHVLLNNEVYNSELYHVADYVPPEKELSAEEAIQFAKSHGFKIA